MMKIFNPATEELIKEIQTDDKSSVQRAHEDLKKGQVEWAAESMSHRLACLRKFMVLLERDKSALGEILSNEVGKPVSQAIGEIGGAIGRISYFVDNFSEVLAPREAHVAPGLIEKVSYDPLGVIANISAWNYPYLVGVNVFVPALLAGNSVLYKPSEFSTLTGLEIERLLLEAGVPSNAFKCIVGTGQVGQVLLGLPLDGYFFTGSYKTGQYIYEQVAPKMVPCQMELGGKDPMFVSEKIQDVKGVAAVAVEGAFYNNGQSCCAVERIYVQESIADEFIAAFIAETKTLKVGDPTEDGIFFGPLSRSEQLDVLEQQVADALAQGAQLELGGKRMDGKGYYFEPTILTNVSHKMAVMKEESFGPVIGIQVVKDEAEAVRLMKDTKYGLTSAIYTTDQEEFEAIASQMNSGTVYWNCCDRVSPHVPWSGRGHSGFGSTLSEEGIKAFVRPKAWQMRTV